MAADVLAPVLSDGSAVYTPGVSQRRNNATTFDLGDRLGTASRQTDAAKSTTATRSYDAFGMLVASTGTPKGPFGFAGGHGYQEDGDTGLKLLGHRYYDPSTGRFLTRDPVKDGRNWYGYVSNNPLRSVDPEGLKEHPIRPGTPEYDKVKARIDSLRAHGQSAAADRLQQMLDQGVIIIEDDPKKTIGHYPGGGEFTLGGWVPQEGGTIILTPGTVNGSSASLESTLLHEWVHVDDHDKGIPGNEQHSTQVTSGYAGDRYREGSKDGSHLDWPRIGRLQDRYGKEFADRDRKRLGGRKPW